MRSKEGKRKGDVLYRIIIAVLVIIILFSLYKIGSILLQYHKGTSQYNKVAEENVEIKDNKNNSDVTVNWRKLMKKYDNMQAWLYSRGTVINYPVVQGDDNSYYLIHMVNGEMNGKGSLFIDYRDPNPFKEFMTIIYGHRMKDGSMFHSLIEYRDHDYYEKHKKMLLVTPDASYDVIVFAAVTIPADSDKYQIEFSGEQDKQDYLDWIQKKTELKTDVEVGPEDRIVMMSTCTYEFDEARLVVYGKLQKRN